LTAWIGEARSLAWSEIPMAKAGRELIKLESTEGTGYFYVTDKNRRTMTEKLKLRKYDPIIRKHCLFEEKKIK
jgi:large subunit ribosomal protein L33